MVLPGRFHGGVLLQVIGVEKPKQGKLDSATISDGVYSLGAVFRDGRGHCCLQVTFWRRVMAARCMDAVFYK